MSETNVSLAEFNSLRYRNIDSLNVATKHIEGPLYLIAGKETTATYTLIFVAFVFGEYDEISNKGYTTPNVNAFLSDRGVSGKRLDVVEHTWEELFPDYTPTLTDRGNGYWNINLAKDLSLYYLQLPAFPPKHLQQLTIRQIHRNPTFCVDTQVNAFSFTLRGKNVHVRESIQYFYSPSGLKSKKFEAEVLNAFFDFYEWDKRDTTSVKKAETTQPVKDYIDALKNEDVRLFQFLSFLHNKKTYNKISDNQLLNTFYANCPDYEAFKTSLQTAYDVFCNSRDSDIPKITRECINVFPGVKNAIDDKKAKQQWQFAQGAKAKAALLGIKEENHPCIVKALEANELPFALFHESGKENNLINVEFDILETALKNPEWKDTILKIAQNAAGRSTYSRRITNYLSFILYTLPAYLDRNAPLPSKGKKKRNWKCMPKFVNSQWELEMAEDTNENGTTKRRSALTPVADNDAGIVHVPYAAMSISGVRTTWCYSELYTVAEKGREDPISDIGGVFPSDIAPKLNGRDDYGLCFYTLTGTSRNQGYPTFLIIFERTTLHGTKIHFHRVHPSRFRGPEGAPTPSSRIIEECYRYMAGNVRAEEIAHQQGDLLLLKCEKPGKSEEPIDVFGFENHEFKSKSDTPVKLFKASGKSRGNTLGWLYSEEGMSMPHPEHEPIENIEAGYFELKRCKSYENNPVSVWVLSID